MDMNALAYPAPTSKFGTAARRTRAFVVATDQKIQAPLHVVGQAGRSLHFSRIKQFARSVGVSLPMQLFSHCSLHFSWVPPEPLNS